VTPSVPLIAFTGAVGYAYSFFWSHPWAIPSWARLVQAVPLALAMALGVHAIVTRLRRAQTGVSAA
jgi:uncharacterized protein (DUF983 family)